MTRRMKSVITAVAAIAALATGGAVFANAQNSGTSTAPNAQAPAQQQEAPDTGQANDAPDKGEANDAPDKGEAKDAPDKGEAKEAPDKGEAPESGSEVPGNDGPGGHADEPGSPNADHQAQGQE